jgi:hypothetical protein
VPQPQATRGFGGALLIPLFLLLPILPLIAFQDPAMQDYANHMARAFIILHADLFRHAYVVHWTPIPDLGWDLWALALGKWLPLHEAATLFFVLYFVLAVGGLFALHCAFNREPLRNALSLTPLLAVPFLMNGGYTKGFFNFDLGLALMLWALAAWLWLGPARWRLRLAAGAAFSLLLYFVHFYAFAVYGLFILGLELPPRLRQGPRGILALARDGFQALPAFTCLILAGNHLNPPPTAYIRPWHRVVDLTLLIDTNHVWLNIILISAMLGAIGWALARGWLRLPARLILPLILCALIFVAIPDSILGTAYVAWRTTLAAVIVAIAALSPAPGRSDGRIVTTLLTLALGITVINSALFALNAQRTADEKQAFLRAIAPMPYGARLFWAHSGGTQHALIAGTAGAYHVGSEAVEARHALVQSMFAYQGQQVLAFRDARFSVPGNSQTFLPVIAEGFRARGQNLAAYVGMFDYVLLEGSGDPQTEAQLPQARLIPVNAVGDFRLYAVRKSQRPKTHPSSGMLDAAFRSPDD